MKYEEMILSETTDDYYNYWKEYRDELTDYILSQVSLDDTIAIWGAGGCNDIDIRRLSDDNELILIDRDVDKCEKAIKYENITDRSIAVMDLHFWELDYEWYKLLEAMLEDHVEPEIIIGHIQDAAIRMQEYDYSNIKHADVSIMCGLVSQLNSRIAGLLYIKGKKYTVSEKELIMSEITQMNKLAVNRTMKAVKELTNNMLILGLEAPEGTIPESVAGNKEMLDYLGINSMENEPDKMLIWNFTEFKKYNMCLWLIKIEK